MACNNMQCIEHRSQIAARTSATSCYEVLILSRQHDLHSLHTPGCFKTLKLSMVSNQDTDFFPQKLKTNSSPTTHILRCRGSSYSLTTSAVDGVSCQRHDPAVLYRRGKVPRYSVNRRLSPEINSSNMISQYLICNCDHYPTSITYAEFLPQLRNFLKVSRYLRFSIH
jgi:hypothetical protein